jgi:hypothetical protein
MARVIIAAILVSVAANLALIDSITAFAEEPKLAPEGRGLLPRDPTVFQIDPSGTLSRTIFQSDEHPNFRLAIREFVFPADRRRYTIILPSSALVHFPSEGVENNIGKPGARTVVPARTPIEVVNNSEYPVLVRALVVEAK